MKTEFTIEFQGKRTEEKALIDTVKKLWQSEGNKIKDLSKVELFFKPDENKCYYVINGQASGGFDV